MAPRINMNVLPGEPTDGSGRVCIHLFVQDERGPFVEPSAMHMEGGKVITRPTRGRLACDPKRTVAVPVRNGVTTVVPRTDDPRAVTCYKCQGTSEYRDLMQLLPQE